MVDIAMLSSAADSLKVAIDITKALIGLKVSEEVQSKIIELQSALMTAQSSAISSYSTQMGMIAKYAELENEIQRLKNWDTQKNRYLLVNPWRNAAQVYALKKEFSEGEVAHYICANCFANSSKVILNSNINEANLTLMVCPKCHSTTNTSYSRIDNPKYAEDFFGT